MSDCIMSKSGTRYWYIAKHGSLLPGIHILHKCDTPGCINEDHIFLGTHTDNMRDMSNKGRHVGTKGCHFEVADITREAISKANSGRILSSKLKIEQVKIIRNYPEISIYDFAIMFSVSPKTISRIRKFQTWKENNASF